MRRLVNTSIFLLFGLMMLPTFGAGCAALVQVGDDSGDGQEAGPDDVAGGPQSSASGGGSSSSSGIGGSSSVGAGGSSSTEGGPEPATAGAIALFGSQLPGPSDDSGSSSSAGGVPGPDPNDLVVIIGAPVRSCSAPEAPSECGDWQVSFFIPPALQAPGIIDFTDLEWTRLSRYGVKGPDRGHGDCLRLGGLFTSGTLEIMSINAADVVIRVSGTETDYFDVNGEHTAARCP